LVLGLVGGYEPVEGFLLVGDVLEPQFGQLGDVSTAGGVARAAAAFCP
jgi:hypothetical protein